MPAPWQAGEAMRAEFRGLYAQWRSTLPQASVVGVCGWLGTEGIDEIAAGLACAGAESGLAVTLVNLNSATSVRGLFELPEPGGRAGDLVSWPTELAALTVCEPTEDAGLTAVQSLVDRCKGNGGAAVIALPALSTSSITSDLALSIDGTVLVVEDGRTRREEVHKAIALLGRLPSKFLGAVLNREKQYLPRLIRRAGNSGA
jgi:hypothetical protein